ncbi:MAG: hypothetical protein U9N84_08290 [Actinomycetota bacterium]|nr:hypothetical protein [Actinomycetota bacterium]
MSKANKWFGPIGGILFVVAVIPAVGMFTGVDAEPSDSASTVLSQFRANGDSIQTGALLISLGLGFLLIFIGHLRTRMRDGGAGWAADGFLAGGVAVVGGWVVLTGAQLAGGVAGESGHAEVAQGAIDFLWNGTLLFTPGLLAVGIAAAAASLLSRAIPIWIGVFAVVVALGALAPWIGILVFVAWVLAASIAELVRAFRPAIPADVR